MASLAEHDGRSDATLDDIGLLRKNINELNEFANLASSKDDLEKLQTKIITLAEPIMAKLEKEVETAKKDKEKEMRNNAELYVVRNILDHQHLWMDDDDLAGII